MQDKMSGIDGSRACLLRILKQTLAAAGIALALAGCGDLSLVDSLQQEAPGDLRFSPATALVPLSVNHTFRAMGGFPPYSVVSGSGTPVDDHTWVFPAQSTITGDSEDFTIEVADWAGKMVTAVVTVYAVGALALNVTEVTLQEGVGWTFTVTGGLPPYT